MSERIALIAAMEREIAPLVRDWRRTRLQVEGQGFRPAFESDRAIVVCSGIGPAPARRAAEALIAAEHPGVLVSVGLAGALDPRWEVGAILQPQVVIDAESGESFAAEGRGTLITVGKTLDVKGKQALRQRYHADAADMEAAAVAAVAERNGLAFRAVKAISDDVALPLLAFDAFIDAHGDLHTGQIALAAALRPWLWLVLWRLRANAARASEELCRVLAHLVVQHESAPVARQPGPAEPVKQDSR